jgi:hypothetical protein
VSWIHFDFDYFFLLFTVAGYGRTCVSMWCGDSSWPFHSLFSFFLNSVEFSQSALFIYFLGGHRQYSCSRLNRWDATLSFLPGQKTTTTTTRIIQYCVQSSVIRPTPLHVGRKSDFIPQSLAERLVAWRSWKKKPFHIICFENYFPFGILRFSLFRIYCNRGNTQDAHRGTQSNPILSGFFPWCHP